LCKAIPQHNQANLSIVVQSFFCLLRTAGAKKLSFFPDMEVCDKMAGKPFSVIFIDVIISIIGLNISFVILDINWLKNFSWVSTGFCEKLTQHIYCQRKGK